MSQSNNHRQLLVQVSLTESELPWCRDRLLASLRQFSSGLTGRVMILLVYQSRTAGEVEVKNFFSSITPVEIISTPVFSASIARNRGIDYALEKQFDYIYFHDAKVFCTDSFVAMIGRAISGHLDLCRGRVGWREQPLARPARLLETGVRQRISPILHTYLWSYLFRVELLTDIRFNEKIGPGEKTELKAGEDTLLLGQLGQQNPGLRVCYFPQAEVIHPPRPGNLSKHLAYARAQGVLFRFFLGRKFSPFWYFPLYLFLFFGAFAGRALLFRKNSWKSLFLLMSGLLDRDNQRALMAEKAIHPASVKLAANNPGSRTHEIASAG